MLSAPVDLGPMGAQARGNEPNRLQVSSKIVNSVVTTGSNSREEYRNLELSRCLLNLAMLLIYHRIL
jgi:hypothetical protein